MIIDVNVSLSRWPNRRLPLDETSKLAAALMQNGVSQAWAGTFDGLLHNDLAAANEWLVDQCRSVDEKLLLPIGAINLSLRRAALLVGNDDLLDLPVACPQRSC